MTPTIAVVDYGSGNLHSVSRAIARVGGSALVTRDPTEVAGADALVIPGVGHFGACMRAICHHGMDRAIEDFRVDRPPRLRRLRRACRCSSRAATRTPEPGLGGAARTRRAAPRRREGAPHGVEHGDLAPRHPVHRRAHATGRASTSCTPTPRRERDAPSPRRRTASTFAAAVASGNVFATQFHPEKSGDAGLHVYERFVRSLA